MTARGDGVHIVAIAGEADADWAPFPATVVGWAQIGAMVRTFKAAGCTELVIVGSVRRPDLAALRPDLGFLAQPAGDPAHHRRRRRRQRADAGRALFREARASVWWGPARPRPSCSWAKARWARVDGRGGGPRRRDAGLRGGARARPLRRRPGRRRSGRAHRGDRGRGGDRRHAGCARCGAGDRSGVLVKRPKPGQELRIDLPAIGPDTVRRAADAGLAGIAVLAGGTLAAGRNKCRSSRTPPACSCRASAIRRRQGAPVKSAARGIEALGRRTPSVSAACAMQPKGSASWQPLRL